MLKKVANFFVRIMNKYLPDAFLFAVILTLIVFAGGIFITDQTPIAMVNHWYGGFWSLLSFSMQMAMVIVTGNAMAQAPIIKNFLKSLAKSAKTPKRAVLITSIVSLIACLINWGFGLVIGALIAREMAKEVKGCDYRLLIATAYSGFIVWHAGLSASIPLTVATGGEAVVNATKGVVTSAIPIAQTIFSPLNIGIVLVILVGLPIILSSLQPAPDKVVSIDPKLLEDEVIKTEESVTPADKIENSKIIWILLLVLGFTAIVMYFINKGFNLDLNIVNFIFMFVGILLHGSLKKYIKAVANATGNAAGVLLQFPFYAGIMGMMTGFTGEGLSLAVVLSDAFVSFSTDITFPLFTFLSAGIVNFFVPSGGGQWAVQAPIMFPASQELMVDPAVTAMAISWGDAWTNMIQPFWALPALAIAKLSAKDIMGYCVITFLYSGLVICAGFLIYGFIV